MSASETRARRGSRAELPVVVTILLGLLLSLVAVLATPQPAFADGFQGTASSDPTDTTCDDAGFGANKVNTPNVGDSSSGAWGEIERTAEQEATATINEGYTVDICIKTGAAVTVYSGASCDHGEADDGVACVVEYDSSGQGGGVSHVSWGNAVFTEPDPEPSATLECGEVESDQFSISYTLDKDGSTDQFDLTGPSGVTDLDEASTSTEVVSDAAAGDYAITDTDATLTVPDDCETLPDPAITLVKEPVIGEGSDLVDEGPNPLLQFSDSDTGSQTALYTYLITNTGEEPLVNLSLADDRIAVGDLDLSACPEVLEVDASCTATGSEDFTLADAEADADGLVTNTGTVEAEGQESGEDVSASDPATIALSVVFAEVQEKDDPDPAPEVESDADEKPAPVVEAEAEELPATGLDAEGLLPLSLLLIAIGAAVLWLDRPWVGVR